MLNQHAMNTRTDIDEQVAQLRDHEPRQVLHVVGEQPSARDRAMASAVVGQIEYARMRAVPGAIVHADGVIELPE